MMTAEPEIPLREPLEFEYRLNRKLARELYNKERMERVLQNKELTSLERQQHLDALVQNYNEKERRFLKERRERQAALEAKLQKIKEKRELTAHRNFQRVRDRESELRAKEQRLRQQEEAYKMDQRRRR